MAVLRKLRVNKAGEFHHRWELLLPAHLFHVGIDAAEQGLVGRLQRQLAELFADLLGRPFDCQDRHAVDVLEFAFIELRFRQELFVGEGRQRQEQREE